MACDNQIGGKPLASRYYRVEALVRCAHRRSLTILGVEQVALMASLIFAGSALILITGTQLLSWYWIVFLAVAGLAAAMSRLRGRIPNAYDTAQLLDRRLALHDTVSTAWHVLQYSELAATAAGRHQLAQAELAAEQVNMAAAFPFRFRRSWALALTLGAVAFALFSVRYLVRHDLDFTSSIVPLHLDRLAARLRDNFAASDRSGALDSNSQDTGGQSTRAAAFTPNDSKMSDVSGVKAPASSANAQNSNPPESSPEASSSDPEAGSNGSGETAGKSAPGTDRTPGAKESADNGSKGAEQGASQQESASEPQNGSNGSLMNRMKDAASSLLAKMKPSGNSQRAAQASARNAAAPNQDQSQSETGPSQNQTSAPQSPQSSAQADSKGNQQGQATEMAQSSQSRTSSSSENSGSNQAKSGIGRQDGGKDLKAAEEQQAMGKLAEIIGKRSQDVSGEMMVEVPSGKEQLRTAYSSKLAEHSDSGGEINRDEIPLAFQQYIRDYMERIHREAVPAAQGSTKH